MKKIFINKSSAVRSGWKILVFLVIYFLIITSINFIVYFGNNILSLFFDFLAILTTTEICTRFFEKKSVLSVGLEKRKTTGKEIFFGFLIAAIMISIIFLIEFTSGYIKFIHMYGFSVIFQNLIFSLFIFTLVAVNEEVLFRGYVFQRLIEGTNKFLAVLIMSVLFGSAHYFNPSLSYVGILNIILAGILFSIAYIKTRSLWVPIGMHLSWNYFQGVVYSFPVSGIKSSYSIFILDQSGPVLLTGSSFGPEGGILVSILLFMVSVHFYKKNWGKFLE